jgi:hypothetical protein
MPSSAAHTQCRRTQSPSPWVGSLRRVRIVEWNLRSRFAAKLAALEALHPDVAILPEAPLINPRPGDTLTDAAISWCSAGHHSFKSLAG